MPSHRHKILVVANDRFTRLFLKVNLAKFEYAVFIAINTAQGLALAKTEKPATVICDSSDNISDALKFCHTLRTDKDFQAMPIVFLASDDNSEFKIAAWRHGADAVLTKPVSIRMLSACIETLARRVDQIAMSSMQSHASHSKCHVSIVDSFINGSLAFLPLNELLQFLHYYKKSGTLVLTGQGASGTIMMRTGEAVYAQSGNVHGEVAVHKMASWHNGTFSFHDKITTRCQNISKSTMKLILECCTGVNGSKPHSNITQTSHT